MCASGRYCLARRSHLQCSSISRSRRRPARAQWQLSLDYRSTFELSRDPGGNTQARRILSRFTRLAMFAVAVIGQLQTNGSSGSIGNCIPSSPDCRAGWSSIATSRSSVSRGWRLRPCAKSWGLWGGGIHTCAAAICLHSLGRAWQVADLVTPLGSGVARQITFRDDPHVRETVWSACSRNSACHAVTSGAVW